MASRAAIAWTHAPALELPLNLITPRLQVRNLPRHVRQVILEGGEVRRERGEELARGLELAIISWAGSLTSTVRSRSVYSFCRRRTAVSYSYDRVATYTARGPRPRPPRREAGRGSGCAGQTRRGRHRACRASLSGVSELASKGKWEEWERERQRQRRRARDAAEIGSSGYVPRDRVCSLLYYMDGAVDKSHAKWTKSMTTTRQGCYASTLAAMCQGAHDP